MEAAHVTQLVDHCHYRYQHPLGLLLISTTLESRGLLESEELGQRISTVYTVPPLTAADVEALLRQSSPDLARTLQKAGVRRREGVMQVLVRTVDGAVRRLRQIVCRAEQIAARRGKTVDVDDLESALGMQS